MTHWLLFGLALASWPLVGAGQTLTNSGATLTVQAGTTLSATGSVQNLAGSTLINSGTVAATGDLTNAGTLASPGTLLFNGATDQTFTPGAASVATLTVNNTGLGGANRLFIPDNLIVTTLLSLQRGLVRTQGSAVGSPLYTLSLPDGATVQGEGPGRYVQGRLAVAHASVSSGAVDFTNGIVLDPNGQNLGAVTVTRTAGLQTAGLSYGQNLSGTNRGIDRVWQVVAEQPVSAATPAILTVSWVADDDNGLTLSTPAQLWRADQASGPWVTQGSPGSVSTRSLTTSVTQLGTFTVSNTSAPLPVTLVSFTVERRGDDGLVQWATASELRNDHFEVESSVDGTTFQRLGQVAGHGTSNQGHRYQYTDSNLARYAVGLVYYRLRQADTDGSITYSPVRTVAVPVKVGLLARAYPNPSALGVAVELNIHTSQVGMITLLLTDALGRQLSQQQVSLPLGTSVLSLQETAKLATGVYLLHVQQDSQQQTLKLVRQ